MSTTTNVHTVRPENHVGFAIAAANFSAIIARLYTEQAAKRAMTSLERARDHLRQLAGAQG